MSSLTRVVRGGFGAVIQYKCPKNDECFAIKVISTADLSMLHIEDKNDFENMIIEQFLPDIISGQITLPEQGSKKIYEKELDMLKTIGLHANIVTLIYSFNAFGLGFLLFECAYCDMQQFREYCGDIISCTFVDYMISDISRALGHIHFVDVIHRDVKLENILMFVHSDAHFTFKLCDFGISEHASDSLFPPQLVGCLSYIPPEILSKNQRYDSYCDIWSFGICCFALRNNLFPWHIAQSSDTAFKHYTISSEFKHALHACHDCSCCYETYVSKMLDFDVNRRPKADDLVAACVEREWLPSFNRPCIFHTPENKVERMNVGVAKQKRKLATN